jgi:hypothetical protein
MSARDTDAEFEGFTPDELPAADLDFSVKEETVTNPDVIVDIKEGEDTWVRIPVTMIELFINKDGPSAVTRTAKVKFPAEWGGQSISQYINGFQAQNQSETGDPYDECRIFMRDQHDDRWQIVHYGYIGGVGPANDTGVFKFWCYDPADLMRGIQVSKSFGSPTIAQVTRFVLDGVDENGRDVGINQRSVFDNIKPYLAGPQEVKQQKDDNSNLGVSEAEQTATLFDFSGSIGFSVGPYQIDLADTIDDIFDLVAGTEVTQGLLGGQKRFQINRHNMVDLMDWFAAEVGGKWHFEPTPDGPILFFDNTSAGNTPEEPDGEIARRVFVEEEIINEETSFNLDEIEDVSSAIEEINDIFQDVDPAEASEGVGPSGFTDKDVFAPVDTLDNSALADIKPFNTLVLYGEATTYRQRYKQRYGAAGAAGAYTEEYPYIELTYGPLLDRAGGYEYSAPPIESDKIYLDQAKKQAIEEFRKHLSEETEGTITLKGEPHIVPYDYIRTIPACNDTFPNAEAQPITYEVNSVKHTRSAGERCTTELGVSITFSESDLDVTAEYRKA